MTENALSPLRERVDASSTLALPSGPDGYRWRPLSVDDAPALTGLCERMSVRDHPTWSESLEEMQEELGHSWITPRVDGVLCLDSAGDPAAYGLVSMPPEPETLVRVFLNGGVDPAHRSRGLGGRLLSWQQERARQHLAASDATLPGWIMGYAPDAAPEHGRLLASHGFEPSRYFTTLECDLADPVVRREHARPEVRIEPFTPELSERVRLAKNTSFADHWGSQPMGLEQWASMTALPSFRPDLSRVALEGDEVVAFVTTEVNEEDWARQGARFGYIGLVGTVPAARRRGLASALLSDVLDAYRAAGLERAVLDVDTDSPTGALGVYTALGFAPTARDVAYRIAY